MDRKTSLALKAAVALLGLNGIIWIVLGVISLVRAGENDHISRTASLAIAVLMFANAAGMLLMGYGVARRIKLYFYLALVFLGVNILLTFTDEFGVYDLITLIIDLVLVGLLIFNRSNYTRRGLI